MSVPDGARYAPIPTGGRARNFKNLTGRRFERWTVLGYTGRKIGGSMWHCRCDCGREKVVMGCTLLDGRSVSCGCYRAEKLAERVTTHGLTRNHVKPAIYTAWRNMLSRCETPSCEEYRNYGGRGIRVCERWHAFANFLADMGHVPFPGAQLNRKDNDGHYEPGNVVFSTPAENTLNKRTTVYIEHGGIKLPMKTWADRTGIPYTAIKARIARGWNHSRAVTEPVRRPITVR